MNLLDRLFGRRSPELAVACGLEHADDSERDERSALVILNPQFHCSDVAVEIGACDASDVERERALIQKYRSWLITQPPHIVAAYEHWLSHFEYQCTQADKAIANGARQKWQQESDQRSRDYEEVLERAKIFPKPDCSRAIR